MKNKILYDEPDFCISLVCEPRITSAGDAVPAIVDLIGDAITKQEYFCVMALDGRSEVIYTRVIHIGTLNQSLVHPREVFSDAIRERAAGIIISHNHPSGTCEPSRADQQITTRLKDAGKLLGIEILDHIIVMPDNRYYSFSEENQL